MALADLFKKKTNNAAFAALLKRGKTDEQCKCIDFFMTPVETKKKGCLKKSEMTIDSYCAYIQSIVDRLNLKQRAIMKIGLDESQISEIPPVCLSSFIRGDGIQFKTNEEFTKFVTSRYSVTWIFFSSTQIYTYTYTFNTTSDDAAELTRDYFYTDITSIKTEHEVEEVIYEVKKKGCAKYLGCLNKKGTYFHNNRHWDTLAITVPGDTFSFYCQTTPTLEQSIQAAKAMIREKKQA